jgi:uncharacterized protein with HEPN domain
MYHSNIELLKHIIDEINYVLSATKDKNKDEVIDDETLKRAVIRSLEIIGEASKKLDPDFKSIHSHIDWRSIAGTRDKLIHDYFGVNYTIVWDIIVNELPDLHEYIETIITENP